jgi:hypothetical protein
MRTVILSFSLILVFSILSSCSREISPVSPSGLNQINPDENSLSQSSNLDKYRISTRGVFGTWKVIIDPGDLSVELTPARSASAIGNIFDADLSQFLTVSPCSNCLRITSVEFIERSMIDLGIGMRHPFENIATRPDLHGFDVRLIFLFATTAGEFPGIPVMRPTGVEENAFLPFLSLLNADGFTSHYDELVTDDRYFIGGTDVPGNLNPFLRFFEDEGTDPFDPAVPSGHNVMPVGSSPYARTARIMGPQGQIPLMFYLVADVAYGQSAIFSNRTNPQYYLPAFNRTEPWRVEYWLENNSLNSTNPASTADVVVQVFDWQQNATVDPNYPNLANPNGIPESSNVMRLELSVPDLMDNPVIVTTPESGSGTPTDPLQYRIQIQNQKGMTQHALGLLAVRDELYGQASPHGRMPIPVSPSGFPYETLDILDYAIYQYIQINVPEADGTYPYNHEIDVDEDDLYQEFSGGRIHASFFMDISQVMFQYDWDFDYDGVTFDVDGSGLPSPYFDPPNTGITNVGLRVRTNSVPPREYIYTIPIYKQGAQFHEILNTPSLLADTCSESRGNSVAMSSDHYYLAYMSETGGKRDVCLAVYDINGNYTLHNLTQDKPEGCYSPSVQVIEDGVHDGVYVLFSLWNGSNWDVYSTFGNLDGSGFDVSHIQPVAATSNLESYSRLMIKGNKLLAYYFRHGGGLDADIMVAHSDDFAQTWNIYGKVDDDPGIQNNPTVAYCESDAAIYVVYEDYRDITTNNSDLYMASSSNGLDFNPERNLSTQHGYVSEYYPEAEAMNYQLAIAYLSDEEVSGETHLRIKLVYLDADAIMDFKPFPFNNFGFEVSRPSISASVDGRMNVAFAAFYTSDSSLTAVVEEIKFDNEIVAFDTLAVYSGSIGNTTIDVLEHYYPGPAIVSRSFLDDRAVENFVAWTTFEGGVTVSPNPFNWYYGDIDTALIFTKGEE